MFFKLRDRSRPLNVDLGQPPKLIFEYTSFSLSVNFRTVWDLYSWPYLTSLSERALRVQICGRYNNRSSQLTALLRGDSLKIPALPTPRCTMITITHSMLHTIQTKNIECQSPKIQKKNVNLKVQNVH